MTDRFRLESYPTNPRRPSSIWDFETPDGNWWRLVAAFDHTRTSMREAEVMCAALNREFSYRCDTVSDQSKMTDAEVTYVTQDTSIS